MRRLPACSQSQQCKKWTWGMDAVGIETEDTLQPGKSAQPEVLAGSNQWITIH